MLQVGHFEFVPVFPAAGFVHVGRITVNQFPGTVPALLQIGDRVTTDPAISADVAGCGGGGQHRRIWRTVPVSIAGPGCIVQPGGIGDRGESGSVIFESGDNAGIKVKSDVESSFPLQAHDCATSQEGFDVHLVGWQVIYDRLVNASTVLAAEIAHGLQHRCFCG